jgi:hypothetical protein
LERLPLRNVGLAAAACVVVTLAWVSGAGARAVSPPPAMFGRLVAVTSGNWGGSAWRFSASDQVSGDNVGYCFSMSFVGRAHSSAGCEGSGFVINSFPGLPYYGMDLAESIGGGCPGIDYVDGPVVATARTVDIRVSTGRVVRASTIAPPKGLVRNVGFYVARIPCGTQPTTAVGRSSAGRIVARFS